MKSHSLLTARLMTITTLAFSVAALSHAQVSPVARWLFSEDAAQGQALIDEIAACPAQLHGPGQFDTGTFPALLLDGQSVFLTVENPPESLLPGESLTLEAWVSLNSGTTWGGIVGYLQDNGAFEKGWVLGYNNTTFTVSVSTEGKHPYLSGKTTFRPEQWYHVVGTYDDEMLNLYVNGELAGEHDVGPEGWDKRFFIDVTSQAVPGKDNLIAVRVIDTTRAGGLWKPVKLVVPKTRLEANKDVWLRRGFPNAYGKDPSLAIGSKV